MKQLICEICESTDIIKQDGIFVCQTCGCKYTIEEARKLMTGETEKVNNNEKLTKYFQLARTAKEEDDSETAAKYYSLIREEDPKSWEAKFYTIYYETIGCKVKDALSMCQKLTKIAPSILSSIKDNEPEEKQKEHINEVISKIKKIASVFINSQAKEAAADVPNLLITWGDSLENEFSDVFEISNQASYFWEQALSILINTYGTGDDAIDQVIEEYSNKILKYNSSYKIPKSNMTVHSSDSPNEVQVEILKIGHTDFRFLPLVPIPIRYIALGPNSYGGISIKLNLKNIKGKIIKSAELFVTAFDQFGKPAPCSIYHESTRCLSMTGPIEVGKSQEGIWEDIWHNANITNVKMQGMIIEYMDGSKEKYRYEDLNPIFNIPPDSNADEISTISVMRNEYTLTTRTTKFNRLECTLSNGQKFELKAKQTVSIPVKHGKYKITFDFFHPHSCVPKDEQETPEFVVDKDVQIILTPSSKGGYKTNIIK